MAYELVQEEKLECGCVTKYLEHDTWSTSTQTIHLRCKYHQQQENERERVEAEKRRVEAENRSKRFDELKSKLIALAVNSPSIQLCKIMPEMYRRKHFLQRTSFEIKSILDIVKVKNRWTCKEIPTLFYMEEMKTEM